MADSPPSSAKSPTKKPIDEARKRQLLTWRADPEAFCRDVFGLELWDRQSELIRAVRDHRFVACRAGQKVSKSCSAAMLSLWWSTTKRDGKVILTAPTGEQIKEILWVEVRQLYDRALERGHRLGPEPSLVPSTGWQLGPGHSITGRATNKSGRIAGKSGANQLYVVDEASDYDEEILRAIIGNLAGGGQILLISNPRQTSGTFFDAFHDKAHLWHTVHISSLESPNFRGGHVEGLANPDFLARALEDWGEGSPDFEIKVEGNFPTAGLNVVVSLKLLEAAKKRWDRDAFAAAKGTLNLGVDPSRGSVDRTTIVPRRGYALGPPVIMRPGGEVIDGPTIARRAVGVVREHVRPGEKASVKIDSIGIGVSAVDALNEMIRGDAELKKLLEVVPINSSETADDDDHYRNLRAQIHFAARDWLAQGGMVPDDDSQDSRLMRGEAIAAKYTYDNRGRYQVESKDEIKKRLDRSPDLWDGVQLSIYTGASRVARANVGTFVPMPALEDRPFGV